MPSIFLGEEAENILEWILLLATASSIFCVVALLSIVIYGWRRLGERKPAKRR